MNRPLTLLAVVAMVLAMTVPANASTETITVVGCSNTGQAAGGAQRVSRQYARDTGNPAPLAVALPNSLGGNSYPQYGQGSYWGDVDQAHQPGRRIWFQVCVAAGEDTSDEATWQQYADVVAAELVALAGGVEVKISGLHDYEVYPETIAWDRTWIEAQRLVDAVAALGGNPTLTSVPPKLGPHELRNKGVARDHPNPAGSDKLGRWLVEEFTGIVIP